MTGKGKKSFATRFIKWGAISIGSLIAIVVILITAATLWLTPGRLTDIVNKEASQYLNADVKAHNVRFTFWSTFPRLCIQSDSISVRSRNFDSIPERLKAQLPDNADFLLYASKLRGGINILKLLNKKIYLRNLDIDSLDINLVALTDKLNNYDIVTSSSDSTHIPYFRIDGLQIDRTGRIQYRSIPSKTTADIALAKAMLIPAGHTDSYQLNLAGKISLTGDRLRVLRGFPFDFGGDVALRFKPFGISTSNYNITLGKVAGNLTMDLDVDNNVKINNLNYTITGSSLRNLLTIIPGVNKAALQRLNADMAINASARLLTPYSFSSAYLPSIEVDFNVPDGKINYTLADGERYNVRHAGLDGRFIFDGKNPDKSCIDIPQFNIQGMGITLNVVASVTDLTTSPFVVANIQGKGNLSSISSKISALQPYNLKGNIDLDLGAEFRIDGHTIRDTRIDVDIDAPQVAMNYDGYSINLKDFHASSAEDHPNAIIDSDSLLNLPLNLQVSAAKANFKDQQSGTNLLADNLKIDARSGKLDVTESPRFLCALSTDQIALLNGPSHLRLRDINLLLKADKSTKPIDAPLFHMPAEWSADATTLSNAPHTPELLKVRIPNQLRELMRFWHSYADISIGAADMKHDGFDMKTSLRNLDLAASFDSIAIRHADLHAGESHTRFSGSVTNLRQFLTNPVPAPLRMSLNVAIDTLQANKLAHAYTSANPQSAIARGDKEQMAAGPDSISLILPRNLFADIHATARQTRYINLHLYDLLADIHLGNGIAQVDTLHIDADFGEAALKYVYDSSDMQRLGMDISTRVYNIDIVKFFQNFQKLAKSIPAVENLSGTISASVAGRIMMFPNMYLNVPSIYANAYIDGEELALKQNEFIRHVTDMLLLPDDETLRFADLHIHAGVRDNLLEVFPFNFAVDKYSLRLEGVNNFDGDIYYHIGVDKWPLHLPFGVNIKGTYHHPKLRFGGKDWKDKNGESITAGVMDYNKINVFREMKQYLGEFIHTAAVYHGE